MKPDCSGGDGRPRPDAATTIDPAICFSRLSGLIQRFIAFAERKPHLLRSIPRIVVETRSRDRRHPNLFHQILRERDIVGEPKAH